MSRWPNEADVRPVWVTSARPWLDNVFDYLPGGPVYLHGYRREIVDAGFRLRPRADFYQVVEPGDTTLPPELTPVSDGFVADSEIGLVGYELPQRDVMAGDYVPLTLAMSAPITPTQFYVPVVTVGDIAYAFTTDSHLLTTQWWPEEVIVERFDLALPWELPAGSYPITLSFRNLSTNTDTSHAISLGTLNVLPAPFPPATNHLLANFRQRVGLASARARVGLFERRTAPWDEPLSVQPADTIHLTLNWHALDYTEESYTVFIHLIDPANVPLVALDYTPLGGATPTHLWIPKWIPGQQLLDPYRLEIPPDLPPGTYYIEVGLYEMTSLRRLHLHDATGNIVGDRYILGAVVVGGE